MTKRFSIHMQSHNFTTIPHQQIIKTVPRLLSLRPSTVSMEWVCSAWLWSRPTLCPRLLWEASTCQRSSSCTWRGGCTPATSSCAPTPASPTCPNHGRNNQVGWQARLNPQTCVSVCTCVCKTASGCSSILFAAVNVCVPVLQRSDLPL